MDKPTLRALLALTAALLLCAPAAAGAQQTRIINGTPSEVWPAQTSVYHVPSDKVCGGTLVSARWVLTAGHCVTTGSGTVRAAGDFRLHIGTTSRGFGPPLEAMITPVQVIRHPDYGGPASSPRNDLALMQLPAPAPQEPLSLIGGAPRDSEFWAPGVRATILGWGVTDTGDQSDDQLRKAEVPIISDAACASDWNAFIAPTMVCAGGEMTDTCGGDSGGPLMVPRLGAYALVGVTSWGSGQCGAPSYPSPANPIKPGVYARLGDPAINAWVRSWVPTLTLSTSPAAPIRGQEFTLGAALSAGGASGIVWDTNGDEVFGDAAGPEINLTVPSAGTYNVQARATEGDRTAIARERIVVSDPPPPPPPPPPPAPPLPAPPQVPTPRTVANGVGVTSKMTLLTLRTKGVRVRYECERGCAIRGRLSLGPVSARRFGLGRRGTSVTIGSGTARLPQSGTGTLKLKLTKRAKLALRNRERVTISVVTNLTAGSVTVPGKHPVSVRR